MSVAQRPPRVKRTEGGFVMAKKTTRYEPVPMAMGGDSRPSWQRPGEEVPLREVPPPLGEDTPFVERIPFSTSPAAFSDNVERMLCPWYRVRGDPGYRVEWAKDAALVFWEEQPTRQLAMRFDVSQTRNGLIVEAKCFDNKHVKEFMAVIRWLHDLAEKAALKKDPEPRLRDTTEARDQYLKALHDKHPDWTQQQLATEADKYLQQTPKIADAWGKDCVIADDVNNAWDRHKEWGKWQRIEKRP
jgi:hypothetical protein